jgi:uncharacterized LabA/DUF88 family protein
MIKIAVLIDRGNLRVLTQKSGRKYNPDYIEKVAHACKAPGEDILRILYYDCAMYEGRARLPISGKWHDFSGSDQWLRDLARRDLCAVRRGILKFRGWTPKNIPLDPSAGAVTDQDLKPNFEQKGVDMRIGLDIAAYSTNHAVDRFVLITQDTDCVPAMKQARKAGLQIVLINLPNSNLAPELLEHTDFRRRIPWPV